jgi:ribose-phosphate pyrophosphokinase
MLVRSRVSLMYPLTSKLLLAGGRRRGRGREAHYTPLRGKKKTSLYAEPLTLRYIRENFDYKNAVIVSPDAGGAKRATALADRLDLNFALIHKERSRPNEVSRMTLVGDVTGKIAILVDDMADTCGTLCKAADVLMENGAKEVVAIVTHGILSGDACEKVSNSRLSRLVVTDTVPHDDKKKRCAKIDTIDVAPTVCYTLALGRGMLRGGRMLTGELDRGGVQTHA